MLSLVDLVHSVATGPAGRRRWLTPLALLIAIGLLAIVVIAGLSTDRALGLPPLLPGGLGPSLGIPLLVAGLSLHAWCILVFRKASGGRSIGVPLNPPQKLVTVGPYAWVRNPMITAAFAWLSGLGLMLHSLSIVLLWTPAFVALNVLELKLVEEPELERRLGAAYREYKGRFPMFIPRRPGTR